MQSRTGAATMRKKLEAIEMGTATSIIIFSLILIGVLGIAVVIFLETKKQRDCASDLELNMRAPFKKAGADGRGKPGSKSERNASRVSQSGRLRQATVSSISRPGARFR